MGRLNCAPLFALPTFEFICLSKIVMQAVVDIGQKNLNGQLLYLWKFVHFYWHFNNNIIKPRSKMGHCPPLVSATEYKRDKPTAPSESEPFTASPLFYVVVVDKKLCEKTWVIGS